MNWKFWNRKKKVEWSAEDSNLCKHARRELELAGFFDTDGMYGDMLGQAVMELVETFAKQGHSGTSAGITVWAFNKVANFEALTPLTYGDDQWVKHSDNVWQHVRQSSIFTRDQGKTWYDINHTMGGSK